MMKFKFYVLFCLTIFALLGYEYLSLNQVFAWPSVLVFLQSSADQLQLLTLKLAPFFTKFFPEFFIKLKMLDLSPAAGKPISYFFGVLGTFFMLLTNLYIIRKKFKILSRWGSLNGWLDFHIFCGILGPVFIIYHTNFSVDGLVAISFWSMMIVSVSGVIGRYFYLHVAVQKETLVKEADGFLQKLEGYQKSSKLVPGTVDEIRKKVLKMAGGIGLEERAYGLLNLLLRSLWGDFRLATSTIEIPRGLPMNMADDLKEYALLKRKIFQFEEFSRMLGYWHTFHIPFAIFMYIVAVIHILVVMLLSV